MKNDRIRDSYATKAFVTLSEVNNKQNKKSKLLRFAKKATSALKVKPNDYVNIRITESGIVIQKTTVKDLYGIRVGSAGHLNDTNFGYIGFTRPAKVLKMKLGKYPFRKTAKGIKVLLTPMTF